MGVVRWIFDEILKIPLDEIRQTLFEDLLPLVPDELLPVAFLMLVMVMAAMGWNLYKGIRWAVRWQRPVPLFFLMLGACLSFVTLLGLFGAVLAEVQGRTTN